VLRALLIILDLAFSLTHCSFAQTSEGLRRTRRAFISLELFRQFLCYRIQLNSTRSRSKVNVRAIGASYLRLLDITCYQLSTLYCTTFPARVSDSPPYSLNYFASYSIAHPPPPLLSQLGYIRFHSTSRIGRMPLVFIRSVAHYQVMRSEEKAIGQRVTPSPHTHPDHGEVG